MRAEPVLSDVAVAISAFRSDESVLRLLDTVEREFGRELKTVIVVDSLGSGVLQGTVAERGWIYENSPVNLGSAGNLARRLEIAAEQGARWCFAINHDGMVSRQLVEALVRCGEAGERVGAVYPKRVMIARGDTVLQPHRSAFALAGFGAAVEQSAPLEVAWDSSNGALYATQPIRERVTPWTGLWMGWEDMLYGWDLAGSGWRQLWCPDAVFADDYEYEKVRFAGARRFITRKPAWYGYYHNRNLLLIAKRTGSAAAWGFLLRRLLREVAFTVLFRSEKGRRLTLLWRGLVDGLRGVTGAGRGFL